MAITHSFRLPIFANFLINQKRSALLERVIAETVVGNAEKDNLHIIHFNFDSKLWKFKIQRKSWGFARTTF